MLPTGLADVALDVTGGPHPDWDEYRQAMVDERRLIVRLVPTRAVGQMR